MSCTSDTTSIDKIMFWREGKWVKLDGISDATLKIHYEQLIIYSGIKILESLNMNLKFKGFFKGEVLILIVNTGTQIRKIKFRIKSNVQECLQVLGQYFPVVNHDSVENRNVFSSKYCNIEEVLSEAIQTMERNDTNTMQLPPNYSTFVKMCLLDPTFPQVVRETQNIIEKL